MTKKAVIMKGDGIGPEVVDSMLKILKESNIQSELLFCEAGSEQWEKNGFKDKSYIPDSTMQALEEADACFKGPTTTIPKPNAPKSVAVSLRQKFELYYTEHERVNRNKKKKEKTYTLDELLKGTKIIR